MNDEKCIWLESNLEARLMWPVTLLFMTPRISGDDDKRLFSDG